MAPEISETIYSMGKRFYRDCFDRKLSKVKRGEKIMVEVYDRSSGYWKPIFYGPYKNGLIGRTDLGFIARDFCRNSPDFSELRIRKFSD